MNLTDLVNRNHILFKKMKKLALKQEKLVENSEIHEFLDVSSQRKRIQQEISSNERRYDKQEKNEDPSGSMEKTARQASEIGDMIHLILQADKRTEELLGMKKDDLSAEIQGFRKGQKALKGYGGMNVKIPRFIDRRG